PGGGLLGLQQRLETCTWETRQRVSVAERDQSAGQAAFVIQQPGSGHCLLGTGDDAAALVGVFVLPGGGRSAEPADQGVDVELVSAATVCSQGGGGSSFAPRTRPLQRCDNRLERLERVGQRVEPDGLCGRDQTVAGTVQPALTEQVVVRQGPGELVQPVGMPELEVLRDPYMELAPPPQQEPLIGCILGQLVLEAVIEVSQRQLIDERLSLERAEVD